MLEEGLILMFVGMGTVFAFLAVLWFAVFCMSKVVVFLNKICPEQTAVAAAPVKSADNNVETAIAIAAAKLRR